ncbi:uncharacterized protein LOC110844896 [Folsomia candida]|uniref:uncharacterized protein LOC110844896 n=1 Tax=Folsomia candida TaxID=158441 RepID=UPI0016051350|nr:uncharacterized protein LOC110844896 [Folsomia candida]
MQGKQFPHNFAVIHHKVRKIMAVLSSTVSFLSILLSILVCLHHVESDKSCKQIMADMTKRQLSGITKCIKGMKFKNGKEKAAKMNCIMKCAMENEGLVSKTGDISREQIDEILIREFPSSLLERANATFQPCVEKYAGTMDANPETDPLCATYDPVIKCLISALPNLCPPA